MLRAIAPPIADEPTVVLLTPGVYNSAYFEHAFLAKAMGIEMVQGSDLFVDDGTVYMRTTRGPAARRRHLPPGRRRLPRPARLPPRLAAGRAGLVATYRMGRVSLANAIGTGVADDKAIYAYVPTIIRYYLGEDAIIPNVQTYLAADPTERAYILEHLAELVVKSVNESGGYGMLIGPHAPKAEHEEYRRRIQADPRGYIAQPTLALSRHPCWSRDRFEGRHVDLRPFVLFGKEVRVTPGGLTRVALRARLAGGELLAGRRRERHLGARLDAGAGRRRPLLDGRYVERGIAVSRLIDVTRHLELDVGVEESDFWGPLVGAVDLSAEDVVLLSPVGSPRIPIRSCSCVRHARDLARGVRESISSEMWEELNTLHQSIAVAGSAATGGGRQRVLPAPGPAAAAARSRAGRVDARARRALALPHPGHVPGAGRRRGAAAAAGRRTCSCRATRMRRRMPTWSAGSRCCARADPRRRTRASTRCASSRLGSWSSCCSTRSSRSRCDSRSAPPTMRSARSRALRSAAKNDPGPAVRTLGRVRADVEHAAVDEIFERGLEEFLSEVQGAIAQVSDEIVATYLRDEPQPSRLVGVARAAMLMAAQQQQQ